MDQVKVILAGIKKYHFWILSVLVLGTGIGLWYMACGNLDAQFETNKTNISSKHQSMTALSTSIDLLPNQYTLDGMKGRIEVRSRAVVDAWKLKYDAQKEFLKWDGVLGSDFLSKVEGSPPIELQTVEGSNKVNLSDAHLDHFRNMLNSTLLPQLATIIGANWSPDQASGGAELNTRAKAGRGSQAVVQWEPSNQSALQQAHFKWERKPNTEQVFYAQEDLWILQAVLKIIARTNEQATSKHKAHIHQLRSIKLGKSALTSAGKIYAIRPMGEKTVPANSPEARSIDQPEDEVPRPAVGRYVDNNNVSLEPSALVSAMTGAATIQEDGGSMPTVSDAYLAVAKRVPVRVHVRMDERYVMKLLAECANSPLTLKVQQMRSYRKPDELLNPNVEEFSGVGGAVSTRFQRGGDSDATEDVFPFDIDVEIFGIMYIYNPPPAEPAAPEDVAANNP